MSNCRNRIIPIGAIVLGSVMVGFLSSCTAQNARQANLQVKSSPAPTSSAQPTRATPQAAPQSATAGSAPKPGQAANCETQNYVAAITWNGRQAAMKLTRRPSTLVLSSPATLVQAADGGLSLINQQGETNTSIVFPATGGCTIQVLSSTGTATVNETGQVTIAGQPDPQQYQAGYNRGYNQGVQDGRNARLSNAGYNPEAAFQLLAQSGDAEFDRGLRDGFFRGFQDGYNSVTNPVPDPQPTLSPTTPALW